MAISFTHWHLYAQCRRDPGLMDIFRCGHQACSCIYKCPCLTPAASHYHSRLNHVRATLLMLIARILISNDNFRAEPFTYPRLAGLPQGQNSVSQCKEILLFQVDLRRHTDPMRHIPWVLMHWERDHLHGILFDQASSNHARTPLLSIRGPIGRYWQAHGKHRGSHRQRHHSFCAKGMCHHPSSPPCQLGGVALYLLLATCGQNVKACCHLSVWFMLILPNDGNKMVGNTH